MGLVFYDYYDGTGELIDHISNSGVGYREGVGRLEDGHAVAFINHFGSQYFGQLTAKPDFVFPTTQGATVSAGFTFAFFASGNNSSQVAIGLNLADNEQQIAVTFFGPSLIGGASAELSWSIDGNFNTYQLPSSVVAAGYTTVRLLVDLALHRLVVTVGDQSFIVENVVVPQALVEGGRPFFSSYNSGTVTLATAQLDYLTGSVAEDVSRWWKNVIRSRALP